MFSSTTEDENRVHPSDFEAVPVNDSIREALRPPSDTPDAIRIRPYADNRGIKDGRKFLKSVHRVGDPESAPHAFEKRYVNNVVNFQFIPATDEAANTIETQLGSAYPHSAIERVTRTPTLLSTEGRDNAYIAGATLELTQYSLHPIEHIDLEGFDGDPFASITDQMVSYASERGRNNGTDVVVQTLFTPARRTWTQGINDGPSVQEIGKYLKEDDIVYEQNTVFPYSQLRYLPGNWGGDWVHYPASKRDKRAADYVQDLRGENGWWTVTRVLALASDPDDAAQRVESVASMYGNYYESTTEQTFMPVPVSKGDLTGFIERAATRDHSFSRSGLLRRKNRNLGAVKSEPEAAGYIHVPNEEINNDRIEFMVRSADGGVPPSTPSFAEYDQTGYTETGHPYPTSYEQYCDAQDPESDEEWPFTVIPENPAENEDAIVTKNGHEFAFVAENGEMYAGRWPRTMFENAQEVADQPMFIGVDENGREVPIREEELFKHGFGGGPTGGGKTTVVKNFCCQLSQRRLKSFVENTEDNRETIGERQGCGWTFIDAKGEDTYELYKQLPIDVGPDNTAIIEPKNDYSEYELGFNYLDTFHNYGEPGFEAEVTQLVSSLLPQIDADKFQRIKGAARNMLRSLIYAHNNPEHDGSYSLVDLGDIVDHLDEYEAFLVNEGFNFLLKYARRMLNDLEPSDLEPLFRRVNDWVENAIMRSVVAKRESDISIQEWIMSGNNIFVKIDAIGEEEQQMITTGITQKEWSTMVSREEPIDLKRMENEGVDVDSLTISRFFDRDENGDIRYERIPYFLFPDELHAIINEEMSLEKILAMARSEGMGIFPLTQYFGQLTPDQQRALRVNTSSTFMFPPDDPDERSEFARSFDNLSANDMSLPEYHAWVSVRDTRPKPDAVATHLFPPLPPRRTDAAVVDGLKEIVETLGSKRKPDDELLAEGRFNPASPASADGPSIQPDGEPASGDLTATDRKQLVKAIYDTAYIRATGVDPASIKEAGLEQDTDGGSPFVPLDAVTDHRAWALPDHVATATVPKLAAWIETLHDEGYIQWRETETGSEVRCTGQGTGLFRPTEGGQTEAGLGHRSLLRDTQDAATGLGLRCGIDHETLAQDGTAEADAIWRLPPEFDLPTDAGFREIEAHHADLTDRFPLLVAATDGETTLVEAEKSTSGRPYQTCRNLAGAVNQGYRCLFVCRPDKASTIHATLTDPPFVRDGPGDTDRLYCGDPITIDGETMLRPADSGYRTTWLRNEYGEIVLADSDGEPIVSFPDYESIFTSAGRYPNSTTASSASAATDVDSDAWNTVSKPFIPSREFDAIPDESQWSIIAVPTQAARPSDLSLHPPVENRSRDDADDERGRKPEPEPDPDETPDELPADEPPADPPRDAPSALDAFMNE